MRKCSPIKRAAPSVALLRRTVRWFAQRGVRITRVLTDNGSSFVSHAFRDQAARHTIRLARTRAYRPQTNGKAERFIQTLKSEWAYAAPYATSARRTRQLRPWFRHYNTARANTALGYQPHS